MAVSVCCAVTAACYSLLLMHSFAGMHTSSAREGFELQGLSRQGVT
jgi:hypothetical protein